MGFVAPLAAAASTASTFSTIVGVISAVSTISSLFQDTPSAPQYVSPSAVPTPEEVKPAEVPTVATAPEEVAQTIEDERESARMRAVRRNANLNRNLLTLDEIEPSSVLTKSLLGE
jgi:hypothetical protein